MKTPVDVTKESKRLSTEFRNKRVAFIETGRQCDDVKTNEFKNSFLAMGAKEISATEARANDIKVEFGWTCHDLIGPETPTLGKVSYFLTGFTLLVLPAVIPTDLALRVRISTNNKKLFENGYNTDGTVIFGILGLLIMPFSNGDSIFAPMSQVLINKAIKDIESEDIFS